MARAITNIDVDNDVYAGQSGVPINVTDLDPSPATQIVTIGGETVNVISWSATLITVDVPLHINLKWGISSYQLAVTDDTGTVTLNSVTLSANPNWGTVTFNGSAPNPSTTESFHEHAQTDADLGGGGYTMLLNDELLWESSPGMTVDAQTIPAVAPPATVTGAFKIWKDATSTYTDVSSYTITDGGIFSFPRTSHGPTTLRGLLPQQLTSYTGKEEATPSPFQAAWAEVNTIMGTFKRNTAVTGFTVVLLSTTDGSAITAGTANAFITKDGGTQTAITGGVTHEGNGQWSFNLTATEMDADVIGILVTASGGIAVNHTIITDTSIASDVKLDTAAILLDTGTDGVVISATTADEIADAILNRDFSAVADTNARTALNALRFLRNKYSVAGTTLTVTKEDDSTSAWTSVLTVDPAADPVTGSDPA